MNYTNIKSLILFIIILSFNACSESSGSNNDKNDGYYVTKYQTGNSIYKYEYNSIGQRIKKNIS
jgi:hypothetical protein